MAKRPWVLPVIHIQSTARTLDNAALAFEAGCDGVFLISMDGRDELLKNMGCEVKARWPHKLVGLNYLTRPAVEAIRLTAGAGLDMTWADNAQVHTEQSLEKAEAISAALSEFYGHKFFGGVAFKYQKAEPNPGLAAVRAASLGLIPCTSGPGTGEPADLGKLRAMREALSGGDLAIASGITPANVLDYAPFLSHILVSTGVSKNEYDFDFELLSQLMGKLNTAATA